MKQQAVNYIKSLYKTLLTTILLNSSLLMNGTAVSFEDCYIQSINYEGYCHAIINATDFSSMLITSGVSVRSSGTRVVLLITHKKTMAERFIERQDHCLSWHNQKLG